MPNIEKIYVSILPNNLVESCVLVFWCLTRRVKSLISLSPQQVLPGILGQLPFFGKHVRNLIKRQKVVLDSRKGLWYEINRETIELTNNFYEKNVRPNNKTVSYYEKILKTKKFEAYIKKEISFRIFNILKDLEMIRLFLPTNTEILMIKNPLNEFIAEYIESKYKYKIKLIQPAFTLFFLLGYYTWLFLEFVRRGFVINKARKDYKLSKECAYGFYRKTVRDDIMIDNNRFKKEDVIFLELDDKFYKRIENFKNAREKGLHTDSVPKMKINITGNIFSILFFYFIVPLKAYYYLMLDRKTYLLYYILQFHKKALSIELLMNLYRIKCHISTKDWGDVAETIVLNKYGTKNIIFHWSDLTSYESYDLAFMAHNVYFVWGDIHYNYQSANSFVDEKVNIGCIFKESYNRALRDKENITSAMIGFRKEAKTVVFCDTSFGDLGEYSEEFFIKYMEIIKEFCEKNGNINILLKPKHGRDMVLQLLESNLGRYEKIWKGLSGLRNFIYIDPQKWSVEEVIAISDICVNMGMDSPSTIALICGKNGLYFNNMGNIYHPFAKKYKNILVFDEKDLLFRQMNNILDGKIHYRDVISEREIREYDTFDDDKALERLRENIYELTL